MITILEKQTSKHWNLEKKVENVAMKPHPKLCGNVSSLIVRPIPKRIYIFIEIMITILENQASKS